MNSYEKKILLEAHEFMERKQYQKALTTLQRVVHLATAQKWIKKIERMQSPHHEKVKEARRLMRKGRYLDARQLLVDANHPTANRLIDKIDEYLFERDLESHREFDSTKSSQPSHTFDYIPIPIQMPDNSFYGAPRFPMQVVMANMLFWVVVFNMLVAASPGGVRVLPTTIIVTVIGTTVSFLITFVYWKYYWWITAFFMTLGTLWFLALVVSGLNVLGLMGMNGSSF